MGRRTNSNILRLGLKNLKSKSKYIEKKIHETSIYNFRNSELENFSKYFFNKNNLLIQDFRIQFCKSVLKIYVSFYTSSKSTDLINEINSNQKVLLKKYPTYYKHNKSMKIMHFLKKSKKN